MAIDCACTGKVMHAQCSSWVRQLGIDNFAEGFQNKMDVNDMRTIGAKALHACITDLDPVNQAVKPLGLGDLQRVNPLEVGQGHQGAPQERGGHCLGIAVAAAPEVAAALAAARSLDEVIQHLIKGINGPPGKVEKA